MEYKYFCEKCQYKCNYPSEWKEHIESKKHTGEKRKERSDKKIEEKCKLCDYIPKNLTNYKLHYLNKTCVQRRASTRIPILLRKM